MYVYGDALSDMVLSEIELQDEAQAVERPDWLGTVVTHDPRFRQSTMLRLSREAGRNITLAEVLAARF